MNEEQRIDFCGEARRGKKITTICRRVGGSFITKVRVGNQNRTNQLGTWQKGSNKRKSQVRLVRSDEFIAIFVV